MASVLLSSLFFVIVTYAEVLGTRGFSPSLDKLTTPLDTLADAVGASFMKIPIDIGALLCCLSIVTAAINGAARALLMMGRTGLMPATFGATHPRFETPARALTAIALIVAAISGGALALGRAPVDAFGDCATLCSYGFVLVYGAVAVGASVYLRRRGELRPRNIAISALAVAFLIVPAIGSVYPAPPPPANWYPLGFLAYAVIGIALLWRRSHGDAPLTADPSPMPRPTTSS
jgi:amino acid transporter